MTNEMLVCEWNHQGEDVLRFSDDRFVVDGIPYNLNCDTTTVQFMFMVKTDVGRFEERHIREDGYMDSIHAKWSSPYSPLDYRHGEVDEEVWLRFGLVLEPGGHDHKYYRSIIDAENAEGRQVI